jgi:uncharacterized protein
MKTIEIPDPRPRVDDGAPGTAVVLGLRCVACAYPMAYEALQCPVCRGEVAEARFGPHGTVVASTVLRVGVPGYDPPYSVAYVDLEDGPRVLVHPAGDGLLTPGTRVHVTGLSRRGDITVVPEEAR